MRDNEKINLLYLFPGPTYRPDLPDFKDRFLSLTEFARGAIFSWTEEEQYEQFDLGGFTFFGFVKKYKYALRLQQAVFVLKKVIGISKERRFDVVVCYDPMFTGLLGCIVKLLFGSKLIVEINNFNFNDSLILHYGDGLRIKIKIFLSSIVRRIVCRFSDRIKILTEGQVDSLGLSKWKNKISVFHDFVPTHYFQDESACVNKDILCVGWPFKLKGMELLVESFNRLKDKHPDFKLRLQGHLIDEEYKKIFGENKLEKIITAKPVFYDELKPVIQSCYCFVLPSRTEGVPRVMIESMASGKPVIGTKVGGIPDLIQDGGNGYLVDSGDVDALTDRLDRLLSDGKIARKMGQEGLRMVEEKFSSEKYCEYFKEMISNVLRCGS